MGNYLVWIRWKSRFHLRIYTALMRASVYVCSSPLNRSNQHTCCDGKPASCAKHASRSNTSDDIANLASTESEMDFHYLPNGFWFSLAYLLAAPPLPPFSPANEFHSDSNLKCCAKCIHHGCGWRCSWEKERCLTIRAFLAKHSSPPFHSPNAHTHHIYHLCSEHITNSLNCELLSTTHRMAEQKSPV